MSLFLSTVDELIARATAAGTLQDLKRAVDQVDRRLSDASPEERDEALRRLTAGLPDMHLVPAARVAMTCGAIVESGGDPDIGGLDVLSLLPDALDGAARFHELCEQRGRTDGLIPESGGEDG